MKQSFVGSVSFQMSRFPIHEISAGMAKIINELTIVLFLPLRSFASFAFFAPLR